MLSLSDFLCLLSYNSHSFPNPEKTQHRRPIVNCTLCLATLLRASRVPMATTEESPVGLLSPRLLLSPLQESPSELSLMTAKGFCSQFGHAAPRQCRHMCIPTLLYPLKKSLFVFLSISRLISQNAPSMTRSSVSSQRRAIDL